MIDIDRYRRIDEIFQAALELGPRERASYITQACRGDATLVKEVEDLLASDGQQWELIGTPAFEMVAPLLARDQPELQAGDSIGHYQVVSLLGVGGMGQVYLAEDAKLGRKVALKLLPPSYTRDEFRLRRFQQEARAASALNHPNILTIHELGEVNGEQFIATEFVDGKTLRELMNEKPFSLKETLNVVIQVAGALTAAHVAGIVHRDIKPENIMVRADGYVKILDFGLAKLTEKQVRDSDLEIPTLVLSSPGLVMGTLQYMSPEQCRGPRVDARTDIWSLGVVLYELLAGCVPFTGETPSHLMVSVMEDEPPALSSHADVPGELDRVVVKALQKSQRHRYQSAREMAHDLKEVKRKLEALPGNDPLAAALAAGETPSPEMVVAATTEYGLRPPAAIALAACALLMLVAVVFVSDAIGVHYKIPFDKSPDVLQARAAEIIKQLGYVDQPTDYAVGFTEEQASLGYLTYKDSSPRRWDKLASGQPAVITFWYRQSSDYLRPIGGSTRVLRDDPPTTVPGMTSVLLDTRGRLVKFFRVPPQAHTQETSAHAPDWAVAFNAAGLDINRFTPTEPKWNPSGYADTRAAWQGAYPDQPQMPLRIEAAAYQGKPTYFSLIGPWERPFNEEWRRSVSIYERVSIAGIITLILAVCLGGLLLARYNLKLGRGDRKGAFRLALLILGLEAVGHLTNVHIPELTAEIGLFAERLAWALFVAGLTWVMYIALEPFVRRRWPNLMISWNRLLAGKYRDPLIGREILIGGVCGLAMWLLAFSPRLIVRWLDKPYQIHTFNPPVQLMRSLINQLYLEFLLSLVIPLGIILLGLLFSIALRKRWLAAAGIWLLVTATMVRPPLSWSLVCTGIGVALAVMVTMRYGLLTAYFCFLFLSVLSENAITSNFSVWYAAESVFVLAMCAGLILYGFYTSLAGQRIFPDMLLSE